MRYSIIYFRLAAISMNPPSIKMPLDIKASPVVFLLGEENSTIKKQPGIVSQCCLIKCEISVSPDGIFFYFKCRLYLNHLGETSQSQGSLIQSHGQGINPW